MRKVFLIVLLFFVSSGIMAQQDPMFSHNMYNHMSINPAYAGSENMISTTALYRNQWLGMDGTPQTTAVNINAPVSPFGLTSGIGLNILNDQLGFNNDIGIDLSYAVRFNVRGIGNLAIGLNGGFINNSLSPTWNFPDNSNDVAVPQNQESAVKFDLGAGIFFNNEDMYFGFSATHLNQSKRYNDYDTHYNRHFYLTGGYLLQTSSPSWEFNPSVFIGSDLTTSQLSLSANAIYNKKFWGGVSYRVGEAFVGMIGFELFSGMRLGYSYDFYTSSIRGYNGGSHELMVGYSFTLQKEKPPQQYKSIRFL